MSDVSIYELGKSSDKAKRIAEIHKAAFPDFFLTQLGKSFLTTLYQGYIEDAESGILVAVSRSSKQIVGFIAYSNDYSRFYSELKKNHLLKFALGAAMAALRQPSCIKRLFRALKKGDEVKKVEKYVELASIGVYPQKQGEGIGGKLMDYFISTVDFKKYAYINLETDAVNNEAVNLFYQKKGFKLSRQYVTAEGRRMNEYHFAK